MLFTYIKVLGCDEAIELGSTYGKVPGTILVNIDVIKLVFNIRIELGSLDGSSNVSNDGNLGYTYCKVFYSDEGIKLGSTYGKVIGTILGDVYVITHGIDVETEVRYLDGSVDGSND